MNPCGKATAVVSLFTTSIECKLISIWTRTLKYLSNSKASMNYDVKKNKIVTEKNNTTKLLGILIHVRRVD
jgi:hypothetical protein